MHTVEEIKKNQEEFFDEIISFLKKDLKEAKQELVNLKPKSEEISKIKERFQKKINKFKLTPELDKYFIKKENKNQKFYAIWDDESQEVQIFKFKNEKRKKKH